MLETIEVKATLRNKPNCIKRYLALVAMCRKRKLSLNNILITAEVDFYYPLRLIKLFLL
jgi:hypothetical protein